MARNSISGLTGKWPLTTPPIPTSRSSRAIRSRRRSTSSSSAPAGAGSWRRYHLKQAGVTNFRNIDTAGDFGGVWYWNRYPGIQCDNESYCYLPLLEETGFMPSKKFADGWEIYEYCQVASPTKFGFADRALFHTLINSLRWDEKLKRWRVGTNRGDDIRARFVIMACGVLNMPKLPGIPGIDKFKGKLFHTARWDYDYTGGSYRRPSARQAGRQARRDRRHRRDGDSGGPSPRANTPSSSTSFSARHRASTSGPIRRPIRSG